ncbi:hypothetical protein ACWCPS_25590 [Streptomyces mauvecolor]
MFALNSGVEQGVVAEMTIFSLERAILIESAVKWLTEGVRQALPDEFDILHIDGSEYGSRGMSALPRAAASGEPGRWWGFVSVSSRDAFDVLYNPYTGAAREWIREHLESGAGFIEVCVGVFGDQGDPGAPLVNFNARFDEELPNYSRFGALLGEETLRGRGDIEERLVRAIKWMASSSPVKFLHLSHSNQGGRTELERCLSGIQGNPLVNIPKWPQVLRGYSWIMVIPSGVVDNLGGADALQRTGAFCEIEDMGNGSVWARASDRYREYTPDRVQAVWLALRSALIPGQPRLPMAVPGDPTPHLVYIPEIDPE